MKIAERFIKARSQTQSFLYFAFGSNLSSERIRVQNPSAKFVATALLKGYRLSFNSHSTRWRGSPATIVKTDDDADDGVYGVLWELDLDHLSTLDDQEGVCRNVYQRLMVSVLPITKDDHENDDDFEDAAAVVEAFTYQLCSHRCNLAEEEARPSSTYKQVIVRGAREHQLPDHYLAKLEAIQDNGDDHHVDLKTALASLEK